MNIDLKTAERRGLVGFQRINPKLNPFNPTDTSDQPPQPDPTNPADPTNQPPPLDPLDPANPNNQLPPPDQNLPGSPSNPFPMVKVHNMIDDKLKSIGNTQNMDSLEVNKSTLTDPEIGEFIWGDHFTWKKQEDITIQGKKYTINVVIASLKNTANSIDEEAKKIYKYFEANKERYEREFPQIIQQYLSQMSNSNVSNEILEPMTLSIEEQEFKSDNKNGFNNKKTMTGMMSFKCSLLNMQAIGIWFYPQEYDLGLWPLM